MTKPAILIIVLALAAVVSGAAAEGRFVGGRMAVANVRSNKEVQALGRYSVEEFNRSDGRLGWQSGGLRMVGGRRNSVGAPLTFVEVVEAERQVVAGIKYYLKVKAVQGGAVTVFDAEVVVKPWLESKKLLTFAPSAKQL